MFHIRSTAPPPPRPHAGRTNIQIGAIKLQYQSAAINERNCAVGAIYCCPFKTITCIFSFAQAIVSCNLSIITQRVTSAAAVKQCKRHAHSQKTTLTVAVLVPSIPADIHLSATTVYLLRLLLHRRLVMILISSQFLTVIMSPSRFQITNCSEQQTTIDRADCRSPSFGCAQSQLF